MTLIDQRIIIDAPPHVVWDFISDPTQIKRWHAGYQNISVLTTQQMGLGTRRRCTLATGGKDVIEEITAWAEGFGYEYTLIEGGAFRSLKGRLRLTAGPSGTTVQWTVTYKRKGMIGKVRDMVGGQRQMQTMMAESLRRLRHFVDELGLRMDADYRARVSMRDRMDHEARLQYQRQQAALDDDPGAEEAAIVEDDMPSAEPVRDNQAPPSPRAAHVAEPPRAHPPAAYVVEPSSLRRVTVPAPSADELAPPPEPEEVPAPIAEFETDAEVPDDGVPSFVDELIGEGEQPDDYSYTADTEPKPPAGLREALEAQDIHDPTDGIAAQLADENAAALVPDTLDTPAPQEPGVKHHTSRDMPAVELPPEDGDIPAPEVLPHVIPDVSPTHPLTSAEPAFDADIPPIPLPDEADLEHTRPTPPRGIQSVREQATMTPVAADRDSAPTAPTPARGTPSVQRTPARESGDRVVVPPPTPKTDTGEISIWEVFGTERPSEQDEHALQDLIQSVSAREAVPTRRSRRSRRAPHVRHIQRVMGLRLRLMVQRTRARRFELPEDTDD